jgi:hypothetical protein
MANLFIEAILVGLVTGIIGLVISTLLMFIFSRNFSLKKYSFWYQIFFSHFLSGFLIHIIFEWSEMNKKFCCQKNRYNCK